MAQDKLAGIVRALVGVPQERLVVVQRVANGLNSTSPHGDQFQIELSQFVMGWKPKTNGQPKFELYLHSKQQEEGGWIEGSELNRHLTETGLIDRCMSLEDEAVKGWIANPSTYPEEYKSKSIFLWKSRRGTGRDRSVACLVWRGGRVFVRWGWLERRWRGYYPVLLASP